jgi:tetratricopeptide (TPR) repeat protein
MMPKAKALAEQAIALDSGRAEAWATLASVEELFEMNFARADTLYLRALEIDPRQSRARAQYALWGIVRRSWTADEAIALINRAIQDDPLNAWVGGMHSQILGVLGRHEESISAAARSLEMDPESFYSHWNVMRAHAWAGHHERAIQEAPALLSASGRNQWSLGLLGWTYGRAGLVDRARACHDELEGRSRHEFIAPSWLAITAGAAGMIDDGIRWAEQTIRDRDPLAMWARSFPFWDALRSDPRFAVIMRGIV